MKQFIVYVPTLILFYSLVHPLPAQENQEDSIIHYRELAQQARVENDLLAYLNHIDKIVELAPEDFMARYMQSRAYVLNEKPNEAIETLTFLSDRNSDLLVFIENDPVLKSLKSHPGYKPIEKSIVKKSKPVVISDHGFTIYEKDLFPEGITYDPVSKSFFLGSIHKGKIIKVDQYGKITDFVKAGQDGLLPVIGIKVDAGRKILWAVSSFGRANSSISQEQFGSSGVFKYDLESGQLISKYMLPQEEGHFLNDLTLHSNGDVYLTDSYVPAVYKIDKNTDILEKFVELDGFPNGIDLSPDETTLFVASSGIYTIVLEDKTLRRLKQPPELILSADGLYYYKQSLIVIQNSSINRVLRVYLNDQLSEVIDYEILESNNPIFNIPTTGVISGDYFYFIANSQLTDYDQTGNIFPLNKLKETQILKIKLQ